MTKIDDSRWFEVYYELTAKGREVATLKQTLIRGSILGGFGKWRFTYGGRAVLAYFRKRKTQPRSILQIWKGLPVGYGDITKGTLIKGVEELARRKYLQRVK